MKPVTYPYLPDKQASLMLVSGQIPRKMSEKLEKLGFDLLLTEALDSLPYPVRFHPDMQLVNVAEGVLICSPGVDMIYKSRLLPLGFQIITGQNIPKGSYPEDVSYNIAVFDKLAIMNVRHADPVVLSWILKTGRKIINVNQGYTKCSICYINKDAVITSDKGIFKSLREHHKDVLLIQPTKSIILPGYSHGFIGGSAGLISEKELVFAGNYMLLEDAELIVEFLRKHGIKPVSLTSDPVLDLGSLIPLCVV